MKTHSRGILTMVLLWALLVKAHPIAVFVSVVWLGAELFFFCKKFGRKGLIAYSLLATMFVAAVLFAAYQIRANLQLVAEIEMRGASYASIGPLIVYGSLSHISFGPDIDDDQLATILSTEGLKDVGSISFDQSPITDRGLMLLKRFPGLTFVHLEQTNVTEDGVAEFENQLQGCRILYEPDG